MIGAELLEELLNPTIIGITLWYRCNSKGDIYEFNHFELTLDNHLLFPHDMELFGRPTPTVIIQNGVQKSWKSQKWKYTLGRFNTRTNTIIEEGDFI